MNHRVTTKEEILKKAQQMMLRDGFESLNMRAIAEECGMALGSFYNYYPSKKELMAALTAHIWSDIFNESIGRAEDIPGFVEAICERVRYGKATYPDFFRKHFIHFSQADVGFGKEVMQRYLERLRTLIIHMIEGDERIALRRGVTVEHAYEFVLNQVFAMFIRDVPPDINLALFNQFFYGGKTE